MIHPSLEWLYYSEKKINKVLLAVVLKKTNVCGSCMHLQTVKTPIILLRVYNFCWLRNLFEKISEVQGSIQILRCTSAHFRKCLLLGRVNVDATIDFQTGVV